MVKRHPARSPVVALTGAHWTLSFHGAPVENDCGMVCDTWKGLFDC